MSKATDVAEALISRPLTPKQIRERREAATPKIRLIATNGQILALPPTPGEAPQLFKQLPVQITD